VLVLRRTIAGMAGVTVTSRIRISAPLHPCTCTSARPLHLCATSAPAPLPSAPTPAPLHLYTTTTHHYTSTPWLQLVSCTSTPYTFVTPLQIYNSTPLHLHSAPCTLHLWASFAPWHLHTSTVLHLHLLYHTSALCTSALHMHLRLISLSTSDPLRDWSWVRKWARVGTRELLGPTRTGTVNFHREHKTQGWQPSVRWP